MFAALRSAFRAGAACCALVLSTAAPATAEQIGGLSCEAQYEYNVRGVLSTTRTQINLLAELIGDLKAIKVDYATSEKGLLVAELAQAIKTSANLKLDLIALFVPKGCAVTSIASVVEKLATGQGSNEHLAVEVNKCIWTVNPVVEKTYNLLRLIENLYNNMQTFGDLERGRRDLKNAMAQLDRQIAKHEQALSAAQKNLQDKERELKRATLNYCAAIENVEAERARQAAEQLRRAMDQTRTGVSTIGARHRQVMDQVDAAREQRSSASTQQMQSTLQRLQQQQLMLLQQQQLQQELQRSQPQQRPAYERPQQVQRVQQPPRANPECAQPPTTLSSGRGTPTVQECY
jgi:hypothetical protein